MLPPRLPASRPVVDTAASGRSSDHFSVKSCSAAADPSCILPQHAVEGATSFEANEAAITVTTVTADPAVVSAARPSVLLRSLTVVTAYLSRVTGRGKPIGQRRPGTEVAVAPQPGPDEAPPSVQLLSGQEVADTLRTVLQLAEQAGITANQSRAASSNKKARMSRSRKTNEKSVFSLLESMISYTKNDRFIDLFYASALCQPLLDRLCEWAVCLIPADETSPDNCVCPTTGTPTRSSPTTTTTTGTDEDNSLRPGADAGEAAGDEEKHPALAGPDGRYTEHPFHLLLAGILANLSRRPHAVFTSDHVTRLLGLWARSPSLHLTLLSEKILVNVATLQANRELPVYYPSVYLLNSCKQAPSPLSVEQQSEDYDVDVVFVHGMSGSVFYTWRQNEAGLSADAAPASDGIATKCWPRDWLSVEFPRARIIGVDSSLRPFVWNSACPVDNSKRSLRVRADDLRQQLAAAGVGRRPIVWVTHSAGGVLVKELLRVAQQPASAHHLDSSASLAALQPDLAAGLSHITSALDLMDTEDGDGGGERAGRGRQRQVTRSASCDDIHWSSLSASQPPASATTGTGTRSWTRSHSHCSGLPRDQQLQQEPRDSSLASTGSMLSACGSSPGLAQHTRGIVFISVPHRGNRSLSLLYFRPIRWTLTPEAIELERNNAYLLGLHSWFNLWATRRGIPVLTMTETLPTIFNRFYSVVIVPEDTRDHEMGKVLRIPSDHLYISKPKNPDDPVYTNIVQFIRNTVSR